MAITIAFSEPSTVNTGGNWLASGSVWASGFGLWLEVGIRAGSANALQTSPDTSVWTMRALPSTAARRAIAYTDTLGTIGRAVTVGNGVADWSDDGITWNAATSLPQANSYWDVKWWDAQSLFIAVSGDGVNRVMTSADGKSWTMQTAASALAWSGIAVSDAIAVAVAFSAVAGTQFIQTSPDGVTWTLQTHASVATNRGIVAGGQRLGIGYSADLDMFLFTGTDAGNLTKAYRSTDDGVTWTASQTMPATITNTTNRGYFWIEAAQSWYMSCASARYGESVDGDTWTATTQSLLNVAGYTPMGVRQDTATLLGGTTLGQDTVLLGQVSALDGLSPTSGSRFGGTVVTITGVGLGSVGDGDILFDADAASGVTPNATGTEVTCVTPAHDVGEVTVTVTGIGTL